MDEILLDPEDIVDDRFGPDLPLIREWTQDNDDFAGYITGFDPHAYADREALRAVTADGAPLTTAVWGDCRIHPGVYGCGHAKAGHRCHGRRRQRHGAGCGLGAAAR
jgi:hypothetical protein